MGRCCAFAQAKGDERSPAYQVDVPLPVPDARRSNPVNASRYRRPTGINTPSTLSSADRPTLPVFPNHLWPLHLESAIAISINNTFPVLVLRPPFRFDQIEPFTTHLTGIRCIPRSTTTSKRNNNATMSQERGFRVKRLCGELRRRSSRGSCMHRAHIGIIMTVC